MQHGIYYAYWEHEWNGNYLHYIKKAASLGFDILEIAAGPLPEYTGEELRELKRCAEENQIRLTVGYGPSPEHNIASQEKAVRDHALDFYKDLFSRMEKIGATLIGGALYSCWPIDYSSPVDKAGDWERGIQGMAKMACAASNYGIETLGLECVNRFENHVLNTASEGVAFIKEIYDFDSRATCVKLMLDTFHMNIEEDSIGNAIRTAGNMLGHFQTGECIRRVPGRGRMPWREIRDALKDISYDGTVVMEPFVMPGGTVGKDIKVWRNMIADISETALDEEAKKALEFQRYMLD